MRNNVSTWGEIFAFVPASCSSTVKTIETNSTKIKNDLSINVQYRYSIIIYARIYANAMLYTGHLTTLTFCWYVEAKKSTQY